MHIVALFGEAQKGAFETAYFCRSVAELAEHLGEPPSEESRGLHYAIQALLFEREVIYVRVREEGFSTDDYLSGLALLKNTREVPPIAALCLPGVGNVEIIEATSPICTQHRSCLILTERDLYDYLTDRSV